MASLVVSELTFTVVVVALIGSPVDATFVCEVVLGTLGAGGNWTNVQGSLQLGVGWLEFPIGSPVMGMCVSVKGENIAFFTVLTAALLLVAVGWIVCGMERTDVVLLTRHSVEDAITVATLTST